MTPGSGCCSARPDAPARVAGRRRGRLLLDTGLVRAGPHRRPAFCGRGASARPPRSACWPARTYKRCTCSRRWPAPNPDPSAPAAPAPRAPGQAGVHRCAAPPGEGARRAGQAGHGRDARARATLAVMGANLMDPPAPAGRAGGPPCSARPAWTYRPRSPSSLCRSARGLSAGYRHPWWRADGHRGSPGNLAPGPSRGPCAGTGRSSPRRSPPIQPAQVADPAHAGRPPVSPRSGCRRRTVP